MSPDRTAMGDSASKTTENNRRLPGLVCPVPLFWDANEDGTKVGLHLLHRESLRADESDGAEVTKGQNARLTALYCPYANLQPGVYLFSLPAQNVRFKGPSSGVQEQNEHKP